MIFFLLKSLISRYIITIDTFLKKIKHKYIKNNSKKGSKE